MPGATGYTRNDVILAVGLQCKAEKFKLGDVLEWIGKPEKAVGTQAGGILYYCWEGGGETVAVFEVVDGEVISFCSIANGNNSWRVDEKTGQKIHFNILDEADSYNDADFRGNSQSQPVS